LSSENEVLKALAYCPLSVKEIEWKKSLATLYRALQKLEERGWVSRIEGSRYALTEKGRRALELLSP